MVDTEVPSHTRSQLDPRALRPWTPEGQLLLLEAFQLFGKARFGEEWTGKEWSVRRGVAGPPTPPKAPGLPDPKKTRHSDDTNREIDRRVRYLVDGHLIFLTYEESLQRFEEEKDDLYRLWHEKTVAFERYLATKNQFRQVLHAGRISAKIMSSGGHMTTVPKYIWSGTDADKVLETGQARFSIDSYFPVSVDGIVLVPERDLETFLNNSQDESTEPTVSESDAPIPYTVTEKSAENPLKLKTGAGGRPAKWDWEDCLVEICRILYLDGLPETQAEMVRKLQDWFIGKTGEAPAESEIKKRASKVFHAIREAENS